MRVYGVIVALLLGFNCFSFLKKKNDNVSLILIETVLPASLDKVAMLSTSSLSILQYFDAAGPGFAPQASRCGNNPVSKVPGCQLSVQDILFAALGDFNGLDPEGVAVLRSNMLYPTHYFW